jgi:aspartate kinase
MFNVIKIGGAVLGKPGGFNCMTEIIRDYSSKPLLIVISAFSSATRQLEHAARLAEQGKEKESFSILAKIINEHNRFAKNLLTDTSHQKSLKSLFINGKKEISKYLKGLLITRELTPRTLDTILSYGEYFALHTVNHFLYEHDFSHECIDSTSIIVSDDCFGNAKPLIPETKQKVDSVLLPALEKNGIVLTQGFVAKNLLGETTTMGIESSNFTATLLAELTGAKELTIWTDVNGFRTADPEIVKGTKPIRELNYDIAYKASVNGLKLLYPAMLDHAVEKQIRLLYRSAFEPTGDYTTIDNKPVDLPEPLIVSKENLLLLQFQINSTQEKKELDNWINGNEELSDKIFSISINHDSYKIILPESHGSLLHYPDSFSKPDIKQCSVVTVINANEKICALIPKLINAKSKYEIYDFDYDRNTHTARFAISQVSAPSFIRLIHAKLVD